MSILGAVVRTHPRELKALRNRLLVMRGVEIAADPDDGRLVIVIDDLDLAGTPDAPATTIDPGSIDSAPVSAAETLNAIGRLPEVLSLSLVYEYSGPDAPPPAGMQQIDFRSWRDSLARHQHTLSDRSPSVSGVQP